MFFVWQLKHNTFYFKMLSFFILNQWRTFNSLVFNNLLKNAINYSYPKSSIEIYASQTLSYITVSIKNYGKTIPADELGHIFDKFYRSKEYGESEESGTGLGLAIAKEIVRIHNGSIYAMSNDEITVFEVKLPVAEKQR